MCMSKSSRIQIPVDEEEAQVFKAAARRARLPLATWARRLLRDQARQQLSQPARSPLAALEDVLSLEAPIAGIDTMIEQSYDDRYR